MSASGEHIWMSVKAPNDARCQAKPSDPWSVSQFTRLLDLACWDCRPYEHHFGLEVENYYVDFDLRHFVHDLY